VAIDHGRRGEIALFRAVASRDGQLIGHRIP
jgi:hypothetical protein